MSAPLVPTPLLPPALTDTQSLAIVHVAGAVDRTRFAAGLARLQSAGVRLRQPVPPGDGPGYLAAPDAERAAMLREALMDPDVGAVLCGRGGFGTMRTLEGLPADLLRQHPRWVCGFSDITALHLWAASQGVPTIHGPVTTSLGLDPDPGAAAALLQFLRQPLAPRTFTGLRRVDNGTDTAPVTGRLLGGNLSLLSALVGTRFCPDLDGCILLLEDVGEVPYRLDRMMTTLRLALGTRRPAAVVLGQFTRCELNAEGLAEAMRRWCEPWGCPVVTGLPAGHEFPNLPLVLGLPWTLDPTQGALRTEFGAVTSSFADAPAASVAVPISVGSVSKRAPARASAPLVFSDAAVTGPPWLVDLAQACLAEGACTALHWVVVHEGEVRLDVALGVTGAPDPQPVLPTTCFDIASVTKAVCTALLAAIAVEQGRLHPDDRCPAELSVGRPTLRDLLDHRSGLPAHVPVFHELRFGRTPAAAAADPEGWRLAAQQAFAAIAPEWPADTRTVYSDVGFIALGRWLEVVFGERLDRLFERYIGAALGLEHTGFGPIPASEAVATEWCPWRDQFLQGVVHDENAQVLGGICGHAGLFATGRDVARIGHALTLPFAAPTALHQLLQRRAANDGAWVGGWDTPSGRGSLAGDGLTPDATFGHLGFTGTSLWVDRERAIVQVLLTNRVHPTRDNQRLRPWRIHLHNSALRALGC